MHDNKWISQLNSTYLSFISVISLRFLLPSPMEALTFTKIPIIWIANVLMHFNPTTMYLLLKLRIAKLFMILFMFCVNFYAH